MNCPKLEARVRARNKAGKLLLSLFPSIFAVLLYHYGKKVVNKDGSKVKKLAEDLKELKLPYDNHVYSILNFNKNGIILTVRVYESVNDIGYSEEQYAYIATLEDGFLTELHKLPEIKTDYSAEEVLRLRKEYAKAEKAYRDARSALEPFGEYDR